MSGIFLSYSRADRALADQIVHSLRALGVEAWWDEHMPSVDWQEELERQIHEMAGVVVLWTPSSVASKNVRDEARLGISSEKLVNALYGVAQPPFPFDRVNGLPLDGWTGREPHHGWTRLVQSIETLVVRTGGAKAGEITGALEKREAAVREKEKAVDRAQAAFTEAQSNEDEATETAKTATTAFQHAEEQHQRVVEMRAAALILTGAQQEFEAARVAKDAADHALHAAKGEFSAAARALTAAKTDLEDLLTEASGVSAPPPPNRNLAPAAAAGAPSPPAEPKASAAPGGFRISRPLVIGGGLALLALVAVAAIGAEVMLRGVTPPANVVASNPPPASASVAVASATAAESAAPDSSAADSSAPDSSAAAAAAAADADAEATVATGAAATGAAGLGARAPMIRGAVGVRRPMLRPFLRPPPRRFPPLRRRRLGLR